MHSLLLLRVFYHCACRSKYLIWDCFYNFTIAGACVCNYVKTISASTNWKIHVCFNSTTSHSYQGYSEIVNFRVCWGQLEHNSGLTFMVMLCIYAGSKASSECSFILRGHLPLCWKKSIAWHNAIFETWGWYLTWTV